MHGTYLYSNNVYHIHLLPMATDAVMFMTWVVACYSGNALSLSRLGRGALLYVP